MAKSEDAFLTVTEHNKFSGDELDRLRAEYESPDKEGEDLSQGEIDLLRLRKQSEEQVSLDDRVDALWLLVTAEV